MPAYKGTPWWFRGLEGPLTYTVHIVTVLLVGYTVWVRLCASFVILYTSLKIFFYSFNISLLKCMCVCVRKCVKLKLVMCEQLY